MEGKKRGFHHSMVFLARNVDLGQAIAISPVVKDALPLLPVGSLVA